MNPALLEIRDILQNIRQSVSREIIGQNMLIDKLLITIFAWGHALLEWVPGLWKTKTIRTLSSTLGLDTKRISFTPDLLPSDLTGNEIYRVKEGKFEVRKWPIFTSLLLADEINRTPPKVQSALLEAMEEKRVTLGDKTFELPLPFVVFATQNPLEHEGTYPLPEAQLDRFLMKIILDYPNREDEKKIFMKETGSLEWDTSDTPHQESTLASHDILEMIWYIEKNIHIEGKIFDYVSDIIRELRRLTKPLEAEKWKETFALLSYGPSTRAGLSLIRWARVKALLEWRDYVMPDDIKFLAYDVLRHRIWLSYESLAEEISPDKIIERVLETVKVA